MTRSRISSRSTVGSYPTSERIFEMSGTRRGMSSKPASYACVVRHPLDRRAAAGQRPDLFSQRANGDFVAVADIEDLTDRAWLVDQGYHSRDDVADVGEAAGLRAVAEDGDRLARQRLPHERRDHHPVLARLPRAHRVEQPDDDHRQLALLPVGQRQELVDHLAAGVGPPVLSRSGRAPDPRPHETALPCSCRRPRRSRRSGRASSSCWRASAPPRFRARSFRWCGPGPRRSASRRRPPPDGRPCRSGRRAPRGAARS